MIWAMPLEEIARLVPDLLPPEALQAINDDLAEA